MMMMIGENQSLPRVFVDGYDVLMCFSNGKLNQQQEHDNNQEVKDNCHN